MRILDHLRRPIQIAVSIFLFFFIIQAAACIVSTVRKTEREEQASEELMRQQEAAAVPEKIQLNALIQMDGSRDQACQYLSEALGLSEKAEGNELASYAASFAANAYGYPDFDGRLYEKQMEKFHDSFPSENWALAILDVSEPLDSGGYVYHLCMIKKCEDSVESSYDPFSMTEFNVTVYFDKTGKPSGFLPFAEPLIARYAEAYGFTTGRQGE